MTKETFCVCTTFNFKDMNKYCIGLIDYLLKNLEDDPKLVQNQIRVIPLSSMLLYIYGFYIYPLKEEDYFRYNLIEDLFKEILCFYKENENYDEETKNCITALIEILSLC